MEWSRECEDAVAAVDQYLLFHNLHFEILYTHDFRRCSNCRFAYRLPHPTRPHAWPPYLTITLQSQQFPRAESDIQSRLIPHDEHFLLVPILTLGAQFHIEVPEHAREDGAHFCEGEILQTKGQRVRYGGCG